MWFNNLFTKTYRFITYKWLINFDLPAPDIDKWHRFIKDISEPRDDIEMAYCRYLCRMYYFPWYYKLTANFFAFFSLLFSVPIFFRVTDQCKLNSKKLDSIILRARNVDYEDIVPTEILLKQGSISEVSKPIRSNWVLDSIAKKYFIRCVSRHPFLFHLNYLIFRELCIHSSLINKYDPSAIIVYVNERNVASPLVSALCEAHSKEFVTFMHGDYLLQLIHGFMRFTKFYVWDDHYKQMFINDLRCPKEQFITYVPQKLLRPINIENKVFSEVFFGTYYFGAESINRISKVAEIFQIFKSCGLKMKVRPHPRRSKVDYIKECFRDFVVENPFDIPIDESLSSSEYVISLSSTVLMEAYYKGKKIVIDDISDHDGFNNLLQRRYIMLNKPHVLLSDLLIMINKCK